MASEHEGGRAPRSKKTKPSIRLAIDLNVSSKEAACLATKLAPLRFETSFLLEPGGRRIAAKYIQGIGDESSILLSKAKSRAPIDVSIKTLGNKAVSSVIDGVALYRVDGMPLGISRRALRSAPSSLQIDFAKAWFSQNFVEGAPEMDHRGRIDGSRQGDNLPAHVHLEREFGTILPPNVIEDVAKSFPTRNDGSIDLDFREWSAAPTASRPERVQQNTAILLERVARINQSLAEIAGGHGKFGHNSPEFEPPLTADDIEAVTKAVHSIKDNAERIAHGLVTESFGTLEEGQKRSISGVLQKTYSKLEGWIAKRTQAAIDKGTEGVLTAGFLLPAIYVLRDDLKALMHLLYLLF